MEKGSGSEEGSGSADGSLLDGSGVGILVVGVSRRLRPATALTRYETLVATVISGDFVA